MRAMRDRKDFFTLTYKERGKSFCFKRKGFIVLLITIVFFFFLLCMKIGLLGLIYDFQYQLLKVGFLLASRGLCFLLLRWGCPGILSWGVGFVLRAIFDPEAWPPEGNMMVPGGSGVSSSNPFPRPRLDIELNLPPREEGEVPLEAEDENLLTKRRQVEDELKFLLQLGYHQRGRSYKKGEELLQWIGVANERDPAFLDKLLSRLSELSDRLGARVDRPSQKLSDKEIEALKIWVLNEKDKGLGEG